MLDDVKPYFELVQNNADSSTLQWNVLGTRSPMATR
jgi:hypothetical protein